MRVNVDKPIGNELRAEGYSRQLLAPQLSSIRTITRDYLLLTFLQSWKISTRATESKKRSQKLGLKERDYVENLW